MRKWNCEKTCPYSVLLLIRSRMAQVQNISEQSNYGRFLLYCTFGYTTVPIMFYAIQIFMKRFNYGIRPYCNIHCYSVQVERVKSIVCHE